MAAVLPGKGCKRPRSKEIRCQSTLFSGLTFFISPNAAPDLTAARRSCLVRNILSNDGRISEELTADVTHMIQSKYADVKNTDFPDNKIYTPEWIVSALKNHTLPSSNMFTWKSKSSLSSNYSSEPQSPSAKSDSTDNEPESQSLSQSLDADANPAVQTRMNPVIVDVLGRIAAAEGALGNEFERRAYERARNFVGSLTETLKTEADVDRFLHTRKGIGGKLIARIKEIVTTGECGKLESLDSDEKVAALTKFTSIWGVGNKLANELWLKGCRTIDDVRSIESTLPLAVQKCLKVHDELQIKMSRQEVAKLADVVDSALLKRFPNSLMTICGSYRRNEPMCGDIDMIITPTTNNIETSLYHILNSLITDLTAQGFLTDHLALPSSSNGKFDKCSYMGIAQLNSSSLHRRIDIKMYPKWLRPYALAYFTGDAQFVRSMRLYAKQMGYSLGDHGLFPARYDEQGRSILGPCVNCPTEKDIFDVLGLVFIDPGKRANAVVTPISTDNQSQDKSQSQT
uniref:DNA polymerase n=1 Tax=Spongospora subterranea TaxID=70186 RepID=A0A0H5REF4_9EUKA|eukprot:CRZ11922.1 hypothetical protein [Spongospora subterranea]